MKDEERDNGLESLFRNKLEDNEMVAGSDLTGHFMRRLDRREFFRFNPARLNVWYVLAAVAGLTVAGLLLRSPVRSDDELLPARQDLPRVAVTSDDAGTAGEAPEAYDLPVNAVTERPAASRPARSENPPAGTVVRHDAIITTDKSGPVIITVSKTERNEVPVASPLKGAAIEPSATSGCVPLHVHFTSNAAGSNTLSWNFGDGGTSAEANPYYIFDIPGTYHVTLSLTDGRGRTSTATSLIEAWDNPRASFEIRKNDTDAGNGRLLFVNLSEGAVNYLWDFGDGTFSGLGDPSYKYDRIGRYDVKLVAYSANGCADSVTVSDVFTDDGLYLRFPNAFVPGREGPTGGYYNQRTDEYNQVFHPVASGVDSYNLKIYSKAGLLVFESTDLSMGWDGYHKGVLCRPGVYIWKVRGSYRNGQPIIMAGDVTLINY
ncbi:MAG: PKD domain-containing protein, partial [Bacteroidales bacterium]|nr:PKD domain-containing protein [Bacteroidales bacterium]